MTARKKPLYGGADAAFEVTADELEEIAKPWVFTVAGETYALKSQGTFSLDDMEAVADLADEDMLKAVPMVCADDRTEAFLRKAPAAVLTRVLDAWFRAVGTSVGESDSSES